MQSADVLDDLQDIISSPLWSEMLLVKHKVVHLG
jgi:hypothetical protein